MSLPSGVEITCAGTDITRYVMPAETRFEGLMSAQPGSCSVTVRDVDQELSFTTGDEIICSLDGVVLWGGYAIGVTRKFAFPVVDTVTRAPTAVRERLWVIRGVDYNILFDKRILRNPSDYYHQLPNFDRQTTDQDLILEALVDSKYFDIDDTEFDVVSEVDEVASPFDPLNEALTGDGAWPQQGTTMREFFDGLVAITGAVYYFSPDKKLHYKAMEDVEARWGFSDLPNNAAITGAAGYQDATIGFRELDASEEGGPSTMVDDALIWGGSEWAGSGQTVFARESDATTITNFGRWQVGEVHVGEEGFKLQAGVDARANVIVHGTPSGTPLTGFNAGLRFPQTTISLSWFGHRVPKISAVPDHLRAGQYVHIDLHTFGDGSPLEFLLPLRSLAISFPSQSSDTTPAEPLTWVQFQGTFGLQTSDPNSIWYFLLSQRNIADRPRPVSTVDGSNAATYGSTLSVEPTPAPDDVETVFDLPDDRGYIAGTTDVYVDGAFQRLGTDYTESDPNEGEITFTSPPASSSWIWVVCRVTGA